MINSYKELKFYIQADRIINGYGEKMTVREVIGNLLSGGV